MAKLTDVMSGTYEDVLQHLVELADPKHDAEDPEGRILGEKMAVAAAVFGRPVDTVVRDVMRAAGLE